MACVKTRPKALVWVAQRVGRKVVGDEFSVGRA